MARLRSFLLCNLMLVVLNIQSTESQKAYYYGFFFDEVLASEIKSVTDSYFKTCLDNIPEFKIFIGSASNSSNVTDIYKYYTKPLDTNTLELDPYYHITTKFCGGNADCTSYENKVASSINKIFIIDLIGYYFTNRTFGIRIKLTPEQEVLFDNDQKASKNTSGTNKSSNQVTGLLIFSPQASDFKPTNNTPHITVGCAPGITAEVTGTDLRQIINYEAQFPQSMSANYTINAANGQADVIRYGQGSEDVFVIYPNMKISATATFKAYMTKQVSSASKLGAVGGVIAISLVSLWKLILS